MKNIFNIKTTYFSILVVALVGIFSFEIASKGDPYKTETINVTIKFGRGPSCVGRGACSVDEPGDGFTGNGLNLSSNLEQNNAQFYINSEGNPVLLIFKNAISVSTMETQFINGQFEQLEDLTITNYFSTDDNSEDFEISQGTYPVVDLGDKYSITF